MKVTEQDVLYVADLANLELTDQERRRMLKDLNSILDYIDRLNELDTASVPPMAQISDQSIAEAKSGAGKFAAENPGDNKPASALRKDIPAPCLPHEEALRNAPATDGEFFKVPKVIEK
jgi:aspartyl-tRNA(Asn)/glutamyl-tRNA(Gln) amidotransferase subunit C